MKPSCTFSTIHIPWPWMRQTNDGNGSMPGCRILLNKEEPDTCWVVVFDEPLPCTVTRVPKERRVLFITEPPEVKPYAASYLRQFGTIISPFSIRSIPQGTVRVENSCLNWHYGVETADAAYSSVIASLSDLQAMPVPDKDKVLSVICSTKTYTEAQRKRIAFVERLQNRLGSMIDIYGRGRNPISDKQAAIAPYKYHLVLENNYCNYFWTEKLSDSWLGYAYPIYLGAPNIEYCCPPDGLLALRPDCDEANFEAIERLLQDDPWERSLPAIRECRRWVLETTNVFARVDRLIQEATPYIRAVPNLDKPVPLRQSSRWQRALLRRAMRFGLYNPFA